MLIRGFMSIELVHEKETRALVPLDAGALGCHTAVLAQSGSGKSFLVGRLIEELLLKTRARLIVFDSNSDFVRLSDTDSRVWKTPALQPWLSKRDTLSSFKARWARTKLTLLSSRNLPGAHSLRISWGNLTDHERASVMGFTPVDQPELFWALVLAGEIARDRWANREEPDFDFEHFRGVADELCDYLLGMDGPDDISEHTIAGSLRVLGPKLALRFRTLVRAMGDFDIWRGAGDGERDIADVIARSSDSSAVVIDLLSLETEAERLALVARVLAAAWGSAREAYSAALRDVGELDRRVPTILVIDEAHNLVPHQPKSPAAEHVAADIVRVAAEGRKFGLFLLVVTQRPRRIDPSVLSECDALFLMRMTNASDLEAAEGLFGFLDSSLVSSASSLEVGDVLLQGRIGRDVICHAAPRRTTEGGRSLDQRYWTATRSKAR